MGSFDSSIAAVFTTKSLISKQLTAIVNVKSVGSFVKVLLDELATLIMFQPLATDDGQ